jgi:hypothetical protein
MDELLYRMLVIRLLGGMPETGATELKDLLQQGSATDPRSALLTRMLGISPSSVDGQVMTETPSPEEIDTSRGPMSNSLEVELETLRGRNEAMAAAVGACPKCWGEEAVCPECDGNGSPGSTMPDAAMFSRYVAPAVLIKASEATQAELPTDVP